MFKDRIDVGERLSSALQEYKDRKDVVVAALPRGGVVPAKVIADSLNLPLELIMVKKIGHPLNPEVAIGAVSLHDRILDADLNVDSAYINSETSRLQQLLQSRYESYYGDGYPIDLKGKTVIIVDDGIATGNTILAAIKLLKKESVRAIVIAVPVAPRETIRKLSKHVHEVVCLETPDPFYAIGQYYQDFEQVSDEKVVALLGNK